jgi:hypothetical protein
VLRSYRDKRLSVITVRFRAPLHLLQRMIGPLMLNGPVCVECMGVLHIAGLLHFVEPRALHAYM